jgi:hypothetical protein
MPDPFTGCLVCHSELEYQSSATDRICALCHENSSSTAACVQGHFVCDRCHRASANDWIERVCRGTDARDPIELATLLMRSETVKMHGPEHHFLVPAVLLATYRNAQGSSRVTPAELAEVRRRAERVPGGFCGTHGNCGAGVGVGIFYSVATGTTPLSGESWSQSNRVTAQSLLSIARHGGPRCCKRTTYLSLLSAIEQMAELGAASGPRTRPTCEHSARNRQCIEQACPFFAGS